LNRAGAVFDSRPPTRARISSSDRFPDTASSASALGDIALVDAAHDAIIVRDAADRVVFWNRGAQSLYGWTRREALGLGVRDLFQSRPLGVDSDLEIGTAREWNGLATHRTRDRGDVTVWSRSTPIRDANGEVHSVLQVDRGIDEALSLVDSLRDALVVTTTDGRVVLINSAAAELLGVESRTYVGQQVETFFSKNDTPHEAWTSIDTGSKDALARASESPAELIIRRADGSERPVEMTVMRRTIGELPLHVITLRDISNRLLIEDQLQRTEKTAVITRLAGGIADEFTDLLGAITGCLDRMRPALGEAAALAELDGAREAASRAVQLTQQLLMLTRTDPADAR
jgi:PAS domain S-box-containing protein